jgi:hypothetical protein
MSQTLVDDLAIDLSRFLIFLVISQDSSSIPSIQDSCLKKQILTFLWYSCRQNLVWWGKNYLVRQDSCVLVFLTGSCFSCDSCLNICSCISCLNLFSCTSCLISFFFLNAISLLQKKICTLQRTEKNDKKYFIYLKNKKNI